MNLLESLNNELFEKETWKRNVASVNVEDAYEFVSGEFSKKDKDLDKLIPHFRTNYSSLRTGVLKALGISRVDMPVIEPKDIGKFQKDLASGNIDIFKPYTFGSPYFPKDLLSRPKEDATGFLLLGQQDGSSKDDRVPAVMKKMTAGELKPTQNQIWLDKVTSELLKFGVPDSSSPLLKLTLIASKEGYILDGHHRFASAMLVDPSLKFEVLFVPLDIETLVKVSRSYGNAVGNDQKEHKMNLLNELNKEISSINEGRETIGYDSASGEIVVRSGSTEVLVRGYDADAFVRSIKRESPHSQVVEVEWNGRGGRGTLAYDDSDSIVISHGRHSATISGYDNQFINAVDREQDGTFRVTIDIVKHGIGLVS